MNSHNDPNYSPTHTEVQFFSRNADMKSRSQSMAEMLEGGRWSPLVSGSVGDGDRARSATGSSSPTPAKAQPLEEYVPMSPLASGGATGAGHRPTAQHHSTLNKTIIKPQMITSHQRRHSAEQLYQNFRADVVPPAARSSNSKNGSTIEYLDLEFEGHEHGRPSYPNHHHRPHQHQVDRRRPTSRATKGLHHTLPLQPKSQHQQAAASARIGRHNNNNKEIQSSTGTIYKNIDFLKTEALSHLVKDRVEAWKNQTK